MKGKICSLFLALCLFVAPFPVEAMAAEGDWQNVPHRISSLAELEAFRDAVNNGTDTGEGEYFRLTADIDLSVKYNAAAGKSWEPIGTGEDEHYDENTDEITYGDAFKGTFDGGGHTIRGLYIHKTGPGDEYGFDRGALFGTVDGGTIQNLNVQGHVSVAADNGVAAGIAVTAWNGTILNCTFNGVVECPNYVAAGIVAECVNGGVISGCKTSGRILGQHMVAGILGTDAGTGCTITNCVNESQIIATYPAGGIAGYSSGTITGCTNRGSVTGRTYLLQYEDESGAVVNDEITSLAIGGIVGETLENGVINNCLNTGAVAGNTCIGGICGQFDKWDQESEDRASVTNCLNTGSVTCTFEEEGDHSIGSVAGNMVSQIWDYDTDQIFPGLMAADTVNCYYLVGTAKAGVGAWGDPMDTTVSKTAGDLASGETAYLLQEGNGGNTSATVWGQKLTADDTPVLTDDGEKSVYKLTFIAEEAEYAIKYANPGSPAALPVAPTKDGCIFDGWYKEAACINKWDFTADTVTADTTLYAKWTKKEPIPAPMPKPDEPVIAVGRFADVKPDAWYYGAVKYAVDNRLFYGTGENIFAPDDDMTRGMLAAVLYRLAKEPGAAAGNLFDDVADGRYYSEAIAWAAENSIMTGYGNGKFGPGDPITREQLAAVLWRCAGSPSANGTLNRFTDGSKASGYAVEALRWAAEQGILNGKGNGILDPRGPATRAEVAAMLMRYCEKY